MCGVWDKLAPFVPFTGDSGSSNQIVPVHFGGYFHLVEGQVGQAALDTPNPLSSLV